MTRYFARSYSRFSRNPKTRIKFWFSLIFTRFEIVSVLLMFPNISPAVEFRAKKMLDIWYGIWYGQGNMKVDSGAIVEDGISIGFSGTRFKGGIDILYNTHWNQDFRLKGTGTGRIAWKYIGFESDKISVRVGDFYYTPGQGLVFGMEPEPAMDRERWMRGIKVETKLPWGRLSEVWGVPYEIDKSQKEYEILNDTSDVLFGFNMSTPFLARHGFLLSGRGMMLKMEDNLYTNLWGGGFEFTPTKWDWGSWYLEIAQKYGWDRIDFESQEGWGMYSNLSIYPYGLDLQFINYDKLGTGDIAYRYNLLPILNRSGYSINNGRDEWGFQVSMNKAIGELMFEGSHSEIYTKDKDKKILEYYSGIDFRNFDSSLKFLSLGGIDPHFDQRNELGGEICGNFKNIEGTLEVRKVRGATSSDTISFFDIGLTIKVPIRDIFTVHSTYTIRGMEVIEESPGREWYGVGVTTEIGAKIFLDIWYGKEQGRYACGRGICKYYSSLEGFRLKLNITL